MPDADDDHKSVIPLSRWRAALARARRGRKADAILSEPDAEKLVPQLPVQDLYYAIKEVGLADAQELVALASPEQVRSFIDLDVWERDGLDEKRLNAWIETLVDAGPETLGAAIEAIDPEAIALWLQRQARVYDLTIEQPPEEPEGHYYPTPDRFYMLDILPAGEEGKALERAIDWLYRADLDLARRVIMSAKWEVAADLEEWAYRWRAGRMADLGYVDFYEALSIYRWLDPASVKPDEHSVVPPPPDTPTELPAVLAGALDEGGFFAGALGTLTADAEIAQLQAALVLLMNKAMAADVVEPGDFAAGKAVLERVVAYLGLGLEYLGRGDLVRAGQVLRTVALERIFRVGVSLTLQLKTLADTLVEKGGVRPVELESPHEEVMLALRQRRPLFPRVLEDAAINDTSDTRPFRTLADIARAAAALDGIARQVAARPRE
jgi:hypothetical protein